MELTEIVTAAGSAPSSHNTQPWRWVGSADGVELDLYADRRRALPVNDPAGRELVISCGAALFNLRVAAAHAGTGVRIDPFPTRDPDHLARVRLAGPPGPEAELYDVLHVRRTHHGPFLPGQIPPEVIIDMRLAAVAEGAEVRMLGLHEKDAVAGLVEAADRIQWGNRRWRRELARWMRARWSGDGLPVSPAALLPARLIVTACNLGRSRGAQNATLIADSARAAVLTTTTDEPLDWLRAGQALERVLLTAAAAGISAAFQNQPCQASPELRDRLRVILCGRTPQMVMRLGPSVPQRVVSTRRPVTLTARS